MSQSALDKHLKDLKDDGILLVDEGMVKKILKIKAKVLKIPATKIAETKLKSRIYANVVMLGALTKISHIAAEKTVKKSIVDSVPEATTKRNIEGFKTGLQL
jgi:2-oxoglutarate ferredoxin oxidoreductase subunit gamma